VGQTQEKRRQNGAVVRRGVIEKTGTPINEGHLIIEGKKTQTQERERKKEARKGKTKRNEERHGGNDQNNIPTE